jgi:Ricin-type beta-trefoil lectin domain
VNALVARARSCLTGRADDRGSLPMAMLLILVGLALSGMLATSVNSQIAATRSTAQRSDALDAAQSGIDIGLGHLRTAVTSTGTGDPAKLPCGPFSGSVSGGTQQSYTVTVYYLTSQPPAGDVTWANANKLPCAGTYLTSSTVPIYVLLASNGKVMPSDPGRTVFATYTLHSKSRDNVAGGLIHLYGPNNPDLCFAAPSPTPAAGSALSMQICDSTNDAQKFAYASNLNLVLVASRADGSTGLCLDAGPTNNEAVLFQPCSATTVARQQWSLNDRANFEGTTNGIDLNSICFHLTTAGAAGSPVVLHATASDPSGVSQQDAACNGDYTNNRSFAPDAAAGTGRAGPDTSQLVNFSQFGRCLDVSANSVTATFMVIWPCKQKPSGAIQWNQVWTLPAITSPATSATGKIYVTTGGSNYCLVSPGSIVAGQYPVLQVCPTGALPASMTWTRRAGTGVFATAYRIESTYGAPVGTTYCLQPTDPTATPPDYWANHGDVSKLVVAVCTSAALQKWNASPMILQSTLTDVSEK